MDTDVGDHGTTQTAMDPLSIQGVSLMVRDLDRVERFYRQAVGLELIGRSGHTARLGMGVTPFLQLLHRPDALPNDPAGAGLYHTAFLLPSRSDVGRWLAHANALGLRLDGAADHLVSEAVYLHDPEGNGIEIYADRPRAEWRWVDGPDGPRVQMANSRLDAEGLLRLAARSWAGAPAGTRIGHVHLQVGDVATATRFYAGLVGMDVTATRPGAVFMSTGGYHHHLAANSWESAGAGPRDPRRAGLASVTLTAADDEVLTAIARQSNATDLTGAGLRDPWGTLLRIRLAGATEGETSLRARPSEG
jgi:catechol 2,3-dioxygenase